MNRFNLDADDLGFAIIFTIVFGLFFIIELFGLMLGPPPNKDDDE